MVNVNLKYDMLGKSFFECVGYIKTLLNAGCGVLSLLLLHLFVPMID